MTGEPSISTYSYEAYLALEAKSETKYEFRDGFIVAMAGGTPAHGLIAANITRALGNAIISTNKPCSPYSSDVKIHIEATNRTFYPDLSIVCGKAIPSEKDHHALINPILIVEVLSERTVAFDRGAKFSHYRQIPSLKEYVLISQDEPILDTFYRTEDGTWEINTIQEMSEKVLFKSISCEVAMSDIYRMVPDISEQ